MKSKGKINNETKLKLEYKFKVEDFRELLNIQNKKCYLTGRELTPDTTFAEHLIPLGKGGEHSKDNIILVIDMLSKLKRYYTIEEIIEMAYDLLSNKGSEYGIKVSRK